MLLDEGLEERNSLYLLVLLRTDVLSSQHRSSLEHEYMLTTTDFTLSFLCLQAVKECHEHSHRASFQNGRTK